MVTSTFSYLEIFTIDFVTVLNLETIRKKQKKITKRRKKKTAI